MRSHPENAADGDMPGAATPVTMTSKSSGFRQLRLRQLARRMIGGHARAGLSFARARHE